MIQFDQGTITFAGESSPIKEWVVWFRTISGLHKTVQDAMEASVIESMSSETIRPVPVAIAENGRYEEV